MHSKTLFATAAVAVALAPCASAASESDIQQLSSALPPTACIAVEQTHGIVQHGIVQRDSVSRTVAVFRSRAPPSLA